MQIQFAMLVLVLVIWKLEPAILEVILLLWLANED